MGRNTALRCAGAALPPALAVALLLGATPRDRQIAATSVVRPAATSFHAPLAAGVPDLGPRVAATVSSRREPFPPAALARPRPARTEPTADERTLARSLAEVDRPDAGSRELQDLGTLLTRLLAQRPELGPAAARTLAALHERPVLFQVGRALRAAVDDPATRAELLALASGDATAPDAGREAAIGALGHRRDREALDVFATVLGDDATAGPLARSAAAYELAQDWDAAPAPARTRALACARALAADATAEPRLQAEAWGVLGAEGLDDSLRARARAALAPDAASLDVALAAARALLDSHEPPAAVARGLRPRSQDEPVLAALLARLERGGRLETR